MDQLAKAAHDSPDTTSIPLDKKEIKRLIEDKIQKICQLQYEAAQQQNLHIGTIKRKLEHWPWASCKNRRIETAMARLRIGHSKLKESLFRFNQADDPNCDECGVPETPAHILEECQRFNSERRVMHQALLKIGIRTSNTKILLGGGPYDDDTQVKIRTAMEVFLISSEAIDLI